MIEFDCPRKPVFDHCVFVATPRPAGPLKPDSGHKNRVKSFESEQSISVNPTIITYTTNIEKKKSISSISRANQHLSFEPLYYESYFFAKYKLTMSRPSLEPTLRHIERHPMNYEERTVDVVLHRPDRDTRDTEQQTRADVIQESQHIADTFARVYANNRAAINDASPFNDSHVDHLPVPPEPIDGDEMHEMNSDHASVDLLESSGENVADVNRLKNKGEMLEIADLSDSWEAAAAWEEHWEVTRDAYMFTEKYLQRYGPHPTTRPWSPRSSVSSARDENQQGAAQEQHVTIDEEQLRREKRKNPTPKKNRYANRRRF